MFPRIEQGCCSIFNSPHFASGASMAFPDIGRVQAQVMVHRRSNAAAAFSRVDREWRRQRSPLSGSPARRMQRSRAGPGSMAHMGRNAAEGPRAERRTIS